MALPSSGVLTSAQVLTELAKLTTAQVDSADTEMYWLVGKEPPAGYSSSELYGKSYRVLFEELNLPEPDLSPHKGCFAHGGYFYYHGSDGGFYRVNEDTLSYSSIGGALFGWNYLVTDSGQVYAVSGTGDQYWFTIAVHKMTGWSNNYTTVGNWSWNPAEHEMADRAYIAYAGGNKIVAYRSAYYRVYTNDGVNWTQNNTPTLGQNSSSVSGLFANSNTGHFLYKIGGTWHISPDCNYWQYTQESGSNYNNGDFETLILRNGYYYRARGNYIQRSTGLAEAGFTNYIQLPDIPNEYGIPPVWCIAFARDLIFAFNGSRLLQFDEASLTQVSDEVVGTNVPMRLTPGIERVWLGSMYKLYAARI